MGMNGELIGLAAGDYAATIATAGATLVSLTHGDRDLVATFDADAGVGKAYEGRTLMPWPNRIAGGRYTFGGLEHRVPVNEPETSSALHGLALWIPWAIEEATASSVRLSLRLPGSRGYEFDLLLSATYTLDADRGLTVALAGENLGADAAPFGISSHPYLTCGGAPVDACTLVAPGSRVLLVDENMAPTELVDASGTPWDFRAPSPMDARSVDHAFTGLPTGTWTVELAHPSGSVALTSDAPWVQLYSGEILGRTSVAVEPMTCPPNAFNGPDADVSLAPGERRELSFAISGSSAS